MRSAIRRACLAASLLMASPAWAVEPKAVATGPATTRLGNTVVFRSTGTVNDPDRPLLWHSENKAILSQLTPWDKVDAPAKEGEAPVIHRNAALEFTPDKPGVYQFTLVAQGRVGDELMASFDFFDLVVLDDAPKPDPIVPPVPPPVPPTPPPVPPTPPPVVPPAPPAPSPWAAGIQAAFTQIDQPQTHKLLVAAALAQATRATAARADLATVPAFLQAHRHTVADCMTNNYEAWQPVMLAIKTRLDRANADGTVLTIGQYRAAWVQIAEAMEAAR